MPVGTESEDYKETKNSLERIQQFDVSSLAQTTSLGTSLNFEEITDEAQRIVNLFKQLPVSVLEDLPSNQLTQIKNKANEIHVIFESILTFKPEVGNPNEARIAIINNVMKQYDQLFNALHPIIAYSLHRSADFQSLETKARETIKEINDNASRVQVDLEKKAVRADEILDMIQKVAAEQGVSQQASYFKDEASEHENAAGRWLKGTFWVAGFLLLYAVLLLVLSWFTPTDNSHVFQIIASKILVFAVISYALYTSARIYLNHKHNQIINTHRKNALLTFRALVEAASEGTNHDAVLIQAATCIFSPQPTGYTKDSTDTSIMTSKPIFELISKSIPKT